jgi:Ca2+-transporting ATPase
MLSVLFLILANSSWLLSIFDSFKDKNPYLWFVIDGALFVWLLSLNHPFLQGVFKFGAITFFDLLLAFFAAALSVSWFEAIKLFSRIKKINILS